MTDNDHRKKNPINRSEIRSPGFEDKFIHTKTIETALNNIIRAGKTGQAVTKRAKIILLRGLGKSKYRIGIDTGYNNRTIATWCKRWYRQLPSLLGPESQDVSKACFQKLVIQALKDNPRSGRRPIFTMEQRTHILALACEAPNDNGVPITRWSTREIAVRAVEKGIVPKISHGQVANFLKSGRSKTPSSSILAKFQSSQW